LVDCRISSLPSRWGEKIVIRLLTKDDSLLNIENIQMPSELLEKWKQVVDLPLGMILVTGPTGSGKTTTLYASIASLDRGSTNIITLEDPVEYEMDGITQVQIHTKAGLTFQSGLRSILRQDPDTVLVGEIRDHETAEIACRAALTGHKMFSTLHTNDAASAVTRLVDMGVEPYLLTAALRAVLAQRLVRVLCPDCKQLKRATKTDQARLETADLQEFHVAQGCAKCSGTGYRGRQGVYELLMVEESIHDLIVGRRSNRDIKKMAIKEGMIPLREVSKKLVVDGITSLAEIERVGLLRQD
jgi:type II secretory ATPase GspE/PulE/Tfp pilus assembly ATPase PilB-like protein